MRVFISCLFFLGMPFAGFAASSLEGNWRSLSSSQMVTISEFDGSLTFKAQSFYADGSPVDWFFQFQLPPGRDAAAGEIVSGRVRSVDGYYNCVFDESAKAQLQKDGTLKIHFPVLTYHRETRSVREPGPGYYETRHYIDWNGWEWVSTRYFFPVDRYRVISSQCVVDQRNWVTNILAKTQSPFSEKQ